MNRKSGILSDKHFEENCNEYTAIPLGYINSNYLGFLGNPNLPGIKPTKYPRTAPRPASADVMAVNTARMQGGNLAKNARKILDLYQVGVRDWTPPEVNLMTPQPQQQNDMHGTFPGNNQAVNILPRRQTHQPIGAQITGDTMGRNVMTAEMGTDTEIDRLQLEATVFPNGMSLGVMTNVLDYYKSVGKSQQIAIGARLAAAMEDNGISANQPQIGVTRSILLGRTGTAADRMKIVALVTAVMLRNQFPVDLEQVFAIPNEANLEASGSNDPYIPYVAREATSETELSAARTAEPMMLGHDWEKEPFGPEPMPREGIAMTPTASESPESEYK